MVQNRTILSLTAGTIMTLAAASLIYFYSTNDITSQRPDQCQSAPSFMDASEFTIREHFFRVMPVYDLVTGNNCDVGDINRDWLTFTRRTHIISGGADLGDIETKVISIGYDMTVYDEKDQVISTIDHQILNSLLNFGGYYIEIKNDEGQIMGTLKQDPFALWTQSKWRYFDVLSPAGESIAQIEYTAIMSDTYRVVNNSGIDNRILAGLVSILDQIEDEAHTSSRSSSD